MAVGQVNPFLKDNGDDYNDPSLGAAFNQKIMKNCFENKDWRP